MSTSWPRCSFVAEAAGDPRAGTAPPARQWFLLEHPGPWGRQALGRSGIDPGAVAALARWSQREGGRVLLVRRPGRPVRDRQARRWFHVDSRPGHEGIRGGIADEAELAGPLPQGEPIDGPLYLACTHGRHDTCCAVRGRPVAAALELAEPGRVWECSHLGGCRFAPALVLLPHGFTLGGVPAAEAATITRHYRNGLLDPRFVRGRSAHPPVAQAAQQHARAATGLTGVDALQVRSVSGASDRWTVELTDPEVSVHLRERIVPAGRPLTCAATVAGNLREFDLLDLRRPPC